ncbi:MAG TPA: (d)CMP kinase [Smithella sp.]|nr:(d)CMP kinase [Smithella sp.]
MERQLVITIDGPAGAGKSTVSKILARKMGYVYLDTGALYRGLAYKAMKTGIDTDDIQSLEELCAETKVALKNIEGKMRVYVDGEDVEKNIRTEKIGGLASKISKFAIVRKALLHLQREAGARGGIVAEGRDMGTVVFPLADYKFFLDASLDVRINRRYKELLERGENVEYKLIQKDMIARDYQDKNRDIAPMIVPKEAIKINSDHLSIDEVVEKILDYIV